MNNYLITIIVCGLILSAGLFRLPSWRTCYHCGKAHCGERKVCDDCWEGRS